MKTRLPARVACAATAIILLGACSDDGSTTVAQADDVELVGDDGLGAQTLNIAAEEEDGEVTGEFRVTEVVIRIDCSDTDTDGLVILGGEVTTPEDESTELLGELIAMVIREGNPDSVFLVANHNGAGTCTELLESIPEGDLTNDRNFVAVEAGEDIATG